jgi:hypothetical protein
LFACKGFSGLGLVDKLVDQIFRAGILPRFADLATVLSPPQTYKNINKNNDLYSYVDGEAVHSLQPCSANSLLCISFL